MLAINSKPKNKLGFGLSYGLTSGPAHARQLTALLKKSGYVPTEGERAHIIIAHSAGCWLIPQTAKPKIVMYMGMPLSQASPRHTWSRAIANNHRNEVAQSLRMFLISTYYVLRQPRRNARIVRMAKSGRPVIFPEASVIFIANQHDPWPQSSQLQEYLATRDWAFISLPGSHDDIGHHPERYTAIINHYAQLLA
jgi:hypothetical protein